MRSWREGKGLENNHGF